jgi:hypothetical protein
VLVLVQSIVRRWMELVATILPTGWWLAWASWIDECFFSCCRRDPLAELAQMLLGDVWTQLDQLKWDA